MKKKPTPQIEMFNVNVVLFISNDNIITLRHSKRLCFRSRVVFQVNLMLFDLTFIVIFIYLNVSFSAFIMFYYNFIQRT